MKIILGNHHLEIRAGSELFTAELAFGFRNIGHDVAIFTFFKGAVAEEIETGGIPVFEPEDQDAICGFAPDIVQTNHLPCAHYLRAVVPHAVRVHAMLGVIPPLESPPLDGSAYALGLAVSEEVRDRARRTAFAQSAPIEIFRNWFDDRAVVTAPVAARDEVTRIAVVSNHVSPELSGALDALASEAPLEVDYFGAERRSVVIHGALLANYDCIISIGRTAILAAACGVPCVMADVHGSDGLLTAQNLDAVRRVNFSGRMKRTPVCAAHLRAEFAKIAGLDRQALRAAIFADFSLSARIEWLLARYDSLLRMRRVSPEVTPLPPGEGLVHAELTAEIRRLRRAVAALERSKGSAIQRKVANFFGRDRPPG